MTLKNPKKFSGAQITKVEIRKTTFCFISSSIKPTYDDKF